MKVGAERGESGGDGDWKWGCGVGIELVERLGWGSVATGFLLIHY